MTQASAICREAAGAKPCPWKTPRSGRSAAGRVRPPVRLAEPPTTWVASIGAAVRKHSLLPSSLQLKPAAEPSTHAATAQAAVSARYSGHTPRAGQKIRVRQPLRIRMSSRTKHSRQSREPAVSTGSPDSRHSGNPSCNRRARYPARRSRSTASKASTQCGPRQ